MDDFLLHGYFRVESVFPTDIATDCRDIVLDAMAEANIKHLDQTTWVKKYPMAETYSFDKVPWKYVHQFIKPYKSNHCNLNLIFT